MIDFSKQQKMKNIAEVFLFFFFCYTKISVCQSSMHGSMFIAIGKYVLS